MENNKVVKIDNKIYSRKLTIYPGLDGNVIWDESYVRDNYLNRYRENIYKKDKTNFQTHKALLGFVVKNLKDRTWSL